MIALNDPQCETHPVTASHGGTVYHGHDGLRRWMQELEDSWEEMRAEPEVYFDLGEHTLAFFVAHARGRKSGLEVAMPVAMVTRWRDGLAVCVKQYADRAEAFRDLGVSEDALEPIAP
jgi:ketosteroid isomerase-like protein